MKHYKHTFYTDSCIITRAIKAETPTEAIEIAKEIAKEYAMYDGILKEITESQYKILIS